MYLRHPHPCRCCGLVATIYGEWNEMSRCRGNPSLRVGSNCFLHPIYARCCLPSSSFLPDPARTGLTGSHGRKSQRPLGEISASTRCTDSQRTWNLYSLGGSTESEGDPSGGRPVSGRATRRKGDLYRKGTHRKVTHRKRSSDGRAKITKKKVFGFTAEIAARFTRRRLETVARHNIISRGPTYPP